MSKTRIAFAAAIAALGVASTANAADAANGVDKHKGQIILDVRMSGVLPSSGSPILNANGTTTGLATDVSSYVIPTVGISYFVTDNIAVELIAGTSRHNIRAVGGNTNVLTHSTWVLPPTLSAQYHFAPKATVSPYVGAGVNYMLFYSGHDYNGFTVHVNNGFGAALQGGADIAVNDRANINIDVKKIFFSTDASINAGALKSRVKLDPWVLSAGVGVKF